MRLKVELKIDLALCPMRICRDEMDFEPVAQDPETAGNSIQQFSVESKCTVDITDKMVQPDRTPPGHRQFDHETIIIQHILFTNRVKLRL